MRVIFKIFLFFRLSGYCLVLFIPVLLSCNRPPEEFVEDQSNAIQFPVANKTEWSNPPNILFIITDEQRFDTSRPYGNKFIHTPYLNQIGKEGVVFERSYVTQPICSPSRSSILTGLYPQSTKVTRNGDSLATTYKTLPQYISDSSYRTGYIGKWHLGNELTNLSLHGFQSRISTEDIYQRWERTNFSDYHHWLIDNGFTPDDTVFNIFSREYVSNLPYEYSKTKFIEESGKRFIESNSNSPFVLYLSFLEPHAPFNGPFNDLHELAGLELNETYLMDFPNEEPIRHQMLKINGWSLGKKRRITNRLEKYWGLIHQVDKSIGEILRKLNDQGILENTIIVFTSDHGNMMGKYGLQGKTVMYEEAIRIPLMMYIPLTQYKHRVVETNVSQIDILPTLLDLINSEESYDLPGKSLLPMIKGEIEDTRPVFISWTPYPEKYNLNFYKNKLPNIDSIVQLNAIHQNIYTILTQDGWKLNLSNSDKSQLFSLNTDSLEKENLFYQGNYKAKVDSLTRLIDNWQQEIKRSSIVDSQNELVSEPL